MPLVNARCTNCGANLTVDKTKDAAICQYCGSAFIVEKAINNYNITNTINAGVVNVYNPVKDYEIVGGVLTKYKGESMDPVIPDGVVKIGDHAFERTMIRSVSIPESVIEIGPYAFSYCGNLKKVKLPKKMKKIDWVFFQCDGIEEVELPEGFEEIKASSFSGCKRLRKINIPKSVRSIEANAFHGCESLEKIVLPPTLQNLGGHAFGGCHKLSQINIPSSINNFYSVFEDCWNLKEIFIPAQEVNINNAFNGSGIERVVFSEKLKKLTGEFGWCPRLREVAIPKSVIKNTHFFLLHDMFYYTPFWEIYTKEHRICPSCGMKLNLFGKCSSCGKPRYAEFR